MAAPKRLQLTDAQRAQIKAEFGHDVDEIHFQVEEYPVSGAQNSTLKVLKVNNVAKVITAGVAGGVN